MRQIHCRRSKAKLHETNLLAHAIRDYNSAQGGGKNSTESAAVVRASVDDHFQSIRWLLLPDVSSSDFCMFTTFRLGDESKR
jgi:hypothetical protein